jgi:hypothetical protein
MSRKATTLGLFSIAAAVLLLAVLVHAHGSFSDYRRETTGVEAAFVDSPSRNLDARFQNDGILTRDVTNSSNLKRQPQAVRLLRRVGGQRFTVKTPPTLLVTGVLSTGSDRQEIQIARSQDASGERVEVVLAGGSKLLSWEAASGARTSVGTLDLTDRAVLERLTFDSADQFILAQLRGASYQVVARNLRPDDAPDNYAGPLWDLIRIDDPEADEQKRPLSKWRIYYVNSITGLIDKVVSQQQGERIEADFTGWTDRAGEKSPSTITWTSQGKALMTLNVTNVSLVAQ